MAVVGPLGGPGDSGLWADQPDYVKAEVTRWAEAYDPTGKLITPEMVWTSAVILWGNGLDIPAIPLPVESELPDDDG